MIKQAGILACLYLAQHVAGHPVVRRQDSQVSVNITTVPPVQKPLLFELTRGAPYTSTSQIQYRTGDRPDLKLTHITDDYFLKLNLAGQDRYFRVDTGTGTFWVADPNFGCYNVHEQLVGAACCGLDEPLQLNATNTTVSPFYQSYGDGYYARGNLTTSEVTLDNSTTWPVVVGAADNIRYEGSRIESGVLGLAGPGFVMGDDLSSDTLRPKPFFSQFVSLYPSLPNFFTLGLSRQSADATKNTASYIEFGGRLLRAPGIATEGPVAIVPLLTVPSPVIQRLQPSFGLASDSVGDYVTLDPKFTINGTAVLAEELPFHTKIDSGNPRLVLPTQIALSYNKLWYDERIYTAGPTWDMFEPVEVNCATPPPSLNITYNNVNFTIDGRDLVNHGTDGKCRSLVTGTKTAGVLGVPFLKNVVAVHNLGAKRIEITARGPY